MATTLLQGDCLERMKEIPDRSVDMVLTDPPYNIGVVTQKNNKQTANQWDKIDGYIDWCISWLLECQRVLKPTGVLSRNCFAKSRSGQALNLSVFASGTKAAHTDRRPGGSATQTGKRRSAPGLISANTAFTFSTLQPMQIWAGSRRGLTVLTAIQSVTSH